MGITAQQPAMDLVCWSELTPASEVKTQMSRDFVSLFRERAAKYIYTVALPDGARALVLALVLLPLGGTFRVLLEGLTGPPVVDTLREACKSVEALFGVLGAFLSD